MGALGRCSWSATRGDTALEAFATVARWLRPLPVRTRRNGTRAGRQRLDVNPFRVESEPYAVVGLLAERRFGRLRLFVNGENLNGIRQTRWDPLIRPSRAVDGRWTVDAWAPLDGRTINGGIRVGF